jgi:hypothetical protein
LSFHKNFDFKLWDLKDNEFYTKVHHPRLVQNHMVLPCQFPIFGHMYIYM